MEIYVSKDGAQLGPFPIGEIQRMVAAGQFSRLDYGWHDGLSDWISLENILPEQLRSAPPPAPRQPPNIDFKKQAGAAFGRVAGKITSAAGIEKIEGLSGKEFLSDVFKKRSDDDIEALFITGTRTTTPALDQIDTRWPKPWAFFKALVASLIVFGGFYYGSVQMGNSNMIPGGILVGAFAIPFSILIFFIEMNVARNLSLYQVMKLVFMGGVGSLLITLFLNTIISTSTDSDGNLTWFGAATTGVVEEAAKVLAAIFFMGKRRFTWSLNGLLIGAAIGTGFSAFESAGYALNDMLDSIVQVFQNQDASQAAQIVPHMMHEIELRALLAPGGHVVWAALSVAALWKVKGQSPFQWGMLFDMRFVRVFVIVASLHALWDSPLSIPLFGDEWGSFLKLVILGVVAWIAVLGYIQDGLKQIRRAQQATDPASAA